MKRILFAACLGTLFASGATLLAAPANDHRHLPNLDKRQELLRKEAALAPARQAAVDRLREAVPTATVDVDPIHETPFLVSSPHEFLSGPKGIGKGISAEAAAAIPKDDPHHPVKAFLAGHSDLFGYDHQIFSSTRIKRDYKTPHNGLQTTVWQQELDGIEIFESILIGHVTAKGELVKINTYLMADPSAAADAGVPDRKGKQANPPVSAKAALAAAVASVGEALDANAVQELDKPAGSDRQQRLSASPVSDVTVRLVWLPINAGQMRLCWLICLTSLAEWEMFHVVIDATSGEVLVRRNLTEHATNATYRVYTTESPTPFSPGLNTPSSFQPPEVPRVVITTTALNTNASPLGWINDGDNETRGNNVDAHLDRDGDNQPDLPRPQGAPGRIFDFPLNLTQDPTSYSAASTVQLFYWCNFMHDKLYELGFTEAAGNFQVNNLGRGGLGNDAVLADCQDGRGFDNANFATPPDGQAPRMQMYLWDFPFPNRDGSLDADIVLHEYTHGLSGRLVGGGVLITELQTRGMGEGWSDFYALSLMTDPSSSVDASYPAAAYSVYQLVGLTENYYYGLRHFPYSTDMTKNPLTFKDIDPAQVLPHTGVPMNPIYQPFDPSIADEVHNQGEVWCVTLWDVRANLIKKWGPIIGNQLTLQLVTDGMKLSPANPNFLQARDAIIQADQVNNAGANYNELWAAFAKRGMGGSASSPPSYTTAGVVESFDVPGLALKTATPRDTFTGNANNVIDVNECVELFISLFNNGRRNAINISATLSSTTPGVNISQGDSTYPNIPVGATATNLLAFRIFVTTNFTCGSVINLSLTVHSDQDTRTIPIRLKTGSIGLPKRYDSSELVFIPDGDPRGIDSPLAVSDFDGSIGKVTVSFFATHQWDADLKFELVGPDGTRVVLTDNNGFGFFGGNYGINCTPDSSRTTFDDDANRPIQAGSPPFVGAWRPQQPLANFAGKSGIGANGVWRLHCIDKFFFDTGALQCWSLKLFPKVCSDGGGECSTDLGVSTTAVPNPPILGSNVTFRSVVTNNGPISASGIVFTNILPPGVSFVSVNTTRGACTQTNGIVGCAIGTVPANFAVTINVVGHPTVYGAVTNVAMVDSPLADFKRDNNTNVLVVILPTPTPVIIAAGSHLVSESVLPPNGGLDPGETVTVEFLLQNVGTATASNLVGTLVASDNVNPLSGPQNYGFVPADGSTVRQPFEFQVNGTNGETITVALHLQDGADDLGEVTFTYGLHALFSFANGNVITINDNTSATAYPSTIFVSGVAGVLSRVTATLSNVTHGFADDIDVLLVAPNGRSVVLMSDAGGGNPLNGVSITFDDLAPVTLPDSDRILGGSYRPFNYDGSDGDLFPSPAPAPPYSSTLSAFNGSSPNGRWALYVFDDTLGDVGRIASGWRLNVETLDTVDASADLTVSATATPDPVLAGSNVIYSVSVINHGPDPATGVLVTSHLPLGAVLVSAQTGLGDCAVSGSDVICDFGSLIPQDQAFATIEARLTRSGTATNVLSVAGNESDPNPANSAAVVQTTVNPTADLAVSVAATPIPAIVNQNVAFTVAVTNSGPNSATGVVVTNRLPPGVSVVSTAMSQGSASASGDVVRWTVGSLSSGSSATYTATLRPNALGVLTNSAQIRVLSPVDLAPANNSAVLTVPIGSGPVVVTPAGSVLVAESLLPASGGVDPNETVSMSLALRNIGTVNATALTAVLRNTANISSINRTQAYGSLIANGPAVSRNFTFTASGQSGTTIAAILDLTEGGNSIGSASFPFVLGGASGFTNSTLIQVLDNQAASPYPSSIFVSGLTGVIANVSVTLKGVTHNYPDDIDVLLVAPNGRSVLLMSDVGGSLPMSPAIDLTFDQSAPASLPDSTPTNILSGVYKPTDYAPADTFAPPAPAGPYNADLTLLNGSDPNGTWSLFAQDDEISDEGQIGGWSLRITTVGRLSQPPRIRLVSVTNGHCQFTVDGQAGDKLVIESSPDLSNWAPIRTNVLGSASMTFNDASVLGDRRFYRVQHQF